MGKTVLRFLYYKSDKYEFYAYMYEKKTNIDN